MSLVFPVLHGAQPTKARANEKSDRYPVIALPSAPPPMRVGARHEANINQMNKKIINNLFEFLTYIGRKTNKLIETENYKAILTPGSDWPNRVFSISTSDESLSEIIDLGQRKLLPDIVTLPKPNPLENNARTKWLSRQRNMSLELETLETTFERDKNIHQVKTRKDALDFAKTASRAFGYNASWEAVYLISGNPSKVRVFNYLKNDECVGCGIVFFDSGNNAGFHMIGTIPGERGQGIGKRVTED